MHLSSGNSFSVRSAEENFDRSPYDNHLRRRKDCIYRISSTTLYPISAGSVYNSQYKSGAFINTAFYG